MKLIDPHELKHAGNDTLVAMANGVEKSFDILLRTAKKATNKTVEIYKGRHENPIFQKINDSIVDKIKPIDRLYLNNKFTQPVSISESAPNSINYRLEIDGETIYQESSDGKVNINQSKQFLERQRQEEQESEFTVADAFSSQYDPDLEYESEISPFDDHPPLNSPTQLESEPDLEYEDELSPFDDHPPLNSTTQLESEPDLEYEDELSPFDDHPPLDSPTQLEPEQPKRYPDEAILLENQPQNYSTQSKLKLKSERSTTDNPSQDNQTTQPKPITEQSINSESQDNQQHFTGDDQNIRQVFVFIEKDLEQVKSPRIKQLFKSAISQLREGINKLNKNISRQFEIREQKSAAQTFKKLFDANLEQTGAATFKSDTFNVELQGLSTYQVTDKQGNLKLEFNQERFSGITINHSSLSGKDFKSIAKATESVKSMGADAILRKNLPERIASLGLIAPESDRQIKQDLDTNAVAKTAKSFLHYMGVNSWDREGGQYQIQQSGNDLTIKSKDNNQEILKIKDGQLSSKLKPQDINFFRKLHSTMNLEVKKIREKKLEVSSQLKSKSIPKRFNQQELSR